MPFRQIKRRGFPDEKGFHPASEPIRDSENHDSENHGVAATSSWMEGATEVDTHSEERLLFLCEYKKRLTDRTEVGVNHL